MSDYEDAVRFCKQSAGRGIVVSNELQTSIAWPSIKSMVRFEIDMLTEVWTKGELTFSGHINPSEVALSVRELNTLDTIFFKRCKDGKQA